MLARAQEGAQETKPSQQDQVFLSWREPWEREHCLFPTLQGQQHSLCQQAAVGVWVKDISVYIYMNIMYFIIISLQYLHIKFSD